MASPVSDLCSRKYKARRTSGKRDPQSIRWIVLHSEEASTAESAARYFTTPAAQGSAHLCVDDAICYRCLDNTDVPWGAASAFYANRDGFHIEQAGFARWGSAAWLLHRGTIRRAAYKTALHCRLFGVPVRWVNADELPRHDGITTHNAVSTASRRIDPGNAAKYTHTDPGIFYPRRYFMRLVREYYADLGEPGT
jgi:hypothetical protein